MEASRGQTAMKARTGQNPLLETKKVDENRVFTKLPELKEKSLSLIKHR
jgi:hypothetical protein